MDFYSYIHDQIDTSENDFSAAVETMGNYFTSDRDPMNDPNYRQALWDARKACQDVDFWTHVLEDL